jgi:hypothetical protein
MTQDTAGNHRSGREARPGTNPKYAEAKRDAEAATQDDDRPGDTGTPGGMLGTASHDELTDDPEAESSKMDERLETDER